MLVEAVETVVKPWYRQFYLLRGEAEWASDRVSPTAYESCLEAIDGFVYVGTSMYGHPTDVRVEVHDAEPLDVPADADQVVEVSLAGEGPLAILSWGANDPEATVGVPAGPLRLRASWFGLAAADAHPDNDLGGVEPSPERVLFELWPGPQSERRTIRRWARDERALG